METFHYDDYGLVITGGGNFLLRNLSKDCKTRTITNHDGFSMRIPVKDIRISPETYWNVSSRYCQMNEGHDANCWLCGWYGMDYGTCKCKESGFTVTEHAVNVLKARRKFFKTILSNFFPGNSKLSRELSDEEINKLMYEDHPHYGYLLKLNFPGFGSNREVEIQEMKNRLSHVLIKK